MKDDVKQAAPTEPGEFVSEEDITLENGQDESQFANGVSASFLRFDNEDNEEVEDN